MKKKLLLLSLLTLSLTSLTACEDYSALKKDVQIQNVKTSQVLDNYNKTQKQAKKLEPFIMEAIDSQLVAKEDAFSPIMSTKANSNAWFTQQFHTNLQKMVKGYQSQFPQYDSPDKIDINHMVNKKKYASLTANTVQVLYLMDDTTGVTEQLVMIHINPNYVGYFSIKWVADKVVEVTPYQENI